LSRRQSEEGKITSVASTPLEVLFICWILNEYAREEEEHCPDYE